ncbi:LURP-one-related/scramblase family protein [Pediococcus argentinicus]|uniref:Uncharacterized protein n=1 Tax=Pediococcus argentinicus TaxID=480391 RepID=A0A0R2NJA6_9LACO|nr:hypothetical protein [Pediococcus argentinicus]KRO25847.1 hypothetical protein IV88_GL001382 [Pediococcus argentinicus]NKZ21840.1 hypothetical protein [Pediococcus argentinicus]GEP19010.1 hypothetical protein LSA03_03940 [Pediococcus argentinicus]
MERFYLKSQGLENKGATVIRDQNHNSKYLLVGKWGIEHDALSVYGVSGQLEAEIKQLSVGKTPKFQILMDNQEVGTVSTPIGFIRGFLFVNKLNWLISGNTTTCHFKVRSGMKVILEINRVLINGSAYIELNCFENEHTAVFIGLAAILDRWVQKRPPLTEPKLRRSWNFNSGSASYNNFTKEESHWNSD